MPVTGIQTCALPIFRTASLGFHEGVLVADDVMKAQTAWLRAESEKIDASIDVHLCDVYLSKVLGTLQQ